jgi:transposase-like protein
MSDEHHGIVEALKSYYPHAAHQRYTVHYLPERARTRELDRVATGRP